MSFKISAKQKRALEKITGKRWDTFAPEVVETYFAYTDRGEVVECDHPDFQLLIEKHRFHPVDVGMWKVDFRKGLLFLDDFLNEGYPQAFIDHVFEIYRDACGSIPSCYAGKSNVSQFELNRER